MDYCLEKFTYPSADGSSDIAAYIYLPFTDEYKGILQIVHGMSEYFLRYETFCEFMAAKGYIVCGNDHLGHGYTAECDSALGYTAEKDGVDILASDVNTLSVIVKERFSELPHILIGHSMGSLIARYCIAVYPDITDSCIIVGTIGPGNPVKLGKLVAKANKAIFGGYNRSKFIKKMIFGSYNKPFPKEEGTSAWVCSDQETLLKYKDDPLAGFTFTAQGYYDLFDLIEIVNTKKWAQSIDKEFPILLLSGRQDPCGDCGRGVVKVCEMLVAEGLTNVRCKIYPNSRHEILNDVEKKAVYADISSWVEGICEAVLAEKKDA